MHFDIGGLQTLGYWGRSGLRYRSKKSGENFSKKPSSPNPIAPKWSIRTSTILIHRVHGRGVGWSFSTYEGLPWWPHLPRRGRKTLQCGKGSQRVWGGDPSQLSSCGFGPSHSVLCRGLFKRRGEPDQLHAQFIVSDQKWANDLKTKRIRPWEMMSNPRWAQPSSIEPW